jgi:hypothetical protein
MCTSAPSHAGWQAGSGASCGGPASAGREGLPDGGRHLLRSRGLLCWTKARHFQALPPAHRVLSRELRRNGPVCCELRRALATSETCRVLTVRLAVLPALRHGGTNPRGEYCPYPTRAGGVHAPGPRRPLSDGPTQPKRTHAQATPRRTLSVTIASQTIASSPDGSEISSAASSACGTPAATVGGGCRFRASSTVTSCSSPCNNAFGHSRSRAK